MDTKEKIFILAVLLFTATLIFPNFRIVTIIASVFFLATGLLFNSLKEKMKLLKKRKWILWMLAFFGWMFISILLSHNKAAAFRYLDSRLPLLAIPVCLGLVYIRKELRDRMLIGIGLVITVSSLVCFAYSISRFLKTGESYLLYNDSLTQLTGQQSIYIAVLVNIAIYIFSWCLFIRKEQTLTQRILTAFGILFLFVIAYLLASRSMLACLLLTTLAFATWYIVKKKKYLQGSILLALLILSVVVINFAFPKTINRFKELSYTSFSFQQSGTEAHYNNATVTADEWNGANFRLAAWQCGWELFLRNPILGTGLGDKKEKLLQVYAEKDFQFGVSTKRNVHNNYLDILLSMGVPGLVLFLLGWIILPIYSNWRNNDGLAVITILTFTIAMITEVYLDRSLGGMLLALFVILMLGDKKQKPHKAPI